ncbi:MAG: ABC transporter ATP-binding protein [Lachnospiraceae bacterium]|nr:ABC transporter ATP-binding protein [Lachnospiraceae bacterium]
MKKQWHEIKKNLGYIHKLAPSYPAFSIMNMLLKKGSPFVSTILSAKIIDMILDGEEKHEIYKIVLILVGSMLVITLLRHCLDHALEIGRCLVSDRKRRDIGYKAMRLDYEILERNSTMELISKADSNTDAVGGLGGYLQKTINLCGAFLSCIVALVTMSGMLVASEGTGTGLFYRFLNSNISYVVLLLLVILSIVVNSKCQEKQEKIQYESSQAQTLSGRIYWLFFNLISDYPMGKDIRIFKMQNMIEKNGAKAREDIERVQKQSIRDSLRIYIGELLSQNIFIFAAYLFVGMKAVYGMISVGDVAMYSGAIIILQQEVSNLFGIWIELKTHNTYLKSYTELMETPNEKYEGTLPVEKRLDHEYELEFRNVSFHYPNSDRLILKNISFKLTTGKKLAIVGANGAGKTTFIKLLCRLYDPTEGEILLNGIDIRKYDYDEYIRLFSIVFQDYKIFSFSVAENVAAGPVYDGKRVEECLKEAGIYERVSRMKHGIESRLLKDQQDNDEEGIEISGGEKQKIALARALYRDAPLVILDEPTSALDPLAEQDIYQRFNEMVSDKTAIFISHRMSSCRFCDEVVVFDEGEIVETGIHEELVANDCGVYRKMWDAQAQYYVV